VYPSLTDQVRKGDVIASLKNVFGDMIEEYLAPEDGIVIGKSVMPVGQTGSRVLHLGIQE
jgi:predicted deacylase